MVDFIPSTSKVRLSRTTQCSLPYKSSITITRTLTPYEEWYLKTFRRLPKYEL